MNFFIEKANQLYLRVSKRIGNVLPAVKDNEVVILEQLRSYGNVATYKKYVANLTQSSTDPPVATVLENTIGDIVFTYDSTGYYIGTLTGAFATANKCCFFISKQYVMGDTGGIIVNRDVSIDRDDANSFHITTEAAAAVGDGVLNNTTIEIRIYD